MLTANSIPMKSMGAKQEQAKMRIAFICPFNLDRGSGTPIRAKLNIQAVQPLFETCVVALGGSFLHGNVLTGIWKKRKGRSPQFQFIKFVRMVLQRLESFCPDVIHAIDPLSILPALLFKFAHREARLVFEMHGITFIEARQARLTSRLFLGFFDYIGAAMSENIIAMSYTQRDLICKWFKVRPNKIHVFWGPEDLNSFPYRVPPPAPPLYVGYAGKDNYWQGIETILEAAYLLRDRYEIQFLLAGFPGERYNETAFENVNFIGRVPGEEFPAFLARCHVLLSPRIKGKVTEGQYPQKLSTYLAVGRPVIVSDVNDQPRILKEADCGVVFPAGDAAALARAVLYVRDLSEERRLRMGRNARLFAERYLSLSSLAKRLSDIYMGGKR